VHKIRANRTSGFLRIYLPRTPKNKVKVKVKGRLFRNIETRGAGFRDSLYSLVGCLPPKGKRSQGFSLAVIRYPSGSAKINARPNGLS
jgi:hypothetical protein